MADTGNSIHNEGLPEIELEVEVFGMTRTAVDPTLTIAGEAADAKATGDAIADLASDIAGLFSSMYPVGSVYVTAAESLPAVIASIGTWVEISIPLTWGDIRTGSRNYEEAGEEFEPGNLHSWLRTL